ncbi:hypothetical protein KY289_029896 [Solanum tuberosum]|nr:hypothetical protein KY284_029680 [Solanum tuberosum]KAH0652218.1 hypothetical protein KY289_029896 [Solanum tuberosum]
MKKLPFFLLVILLVEITISVESQTPALLKYVLQWPPTFCIQLNSKEEKLCKEPIPQQQFTLHGVMQADEDGFNIKCDYKDPNDLDKLLEEVKGDLVKFWPSLREDFNETELWKHQWRVHGSCGGTTPHEYFYKAIMMNDFPEQGNLYNYLESSEIIASDNLAYTKQHIVEAIQKLFYDKPHNVYISCVPIDLYNNTHVYLSEVTWCTELEGVHYISCPSKADPTSCPKHALIMLPLPKEQQLDPLFAIMAE